ncbi:MAG: formylglycine-generating enzyme family protein [Saccharospirillaceae bacterium]|nr:formylglycine-generating enzyme family protein [Pseudomonadales bacterium]NRB80273.1 formylglycine-generating enzyme family protein [Saccharospirillaceae bacterium]
MLEVETFNEQGFIIPKPLNDTDVLIEFIDDMFLPESKVPKEYKNTEWEYLIGTLYQFRTTDLSIDSGEMSIFDFMHENEGRILYFVYKEHNNKMGISVFFEFDSSVENPFGLVTLIEKGDQINISLYSTNELQIAEKYAQILLMNIQDTQLPNNGRVTEKTFKMLNIPKGDFLMGGGDEISLHKVEINSFKIMESEVTWEMYQPCIDAGVCAFNKGRGYGVNLKGDDLPVTNVNYSDIQKYINWIKNELGVTFTLPSEAQWEYAARSGGIGEYTWGYEELLNMANCFNCSIEERGSMPIKSFLPNNFGLFDVHGNVYEIVEDCYNDEIYGAPTNGDAWLDGDCSMSVIRGGSWSDSMKYLKFSERDYISKNDRDDYTGFRLMMDNQ